MLAIAEWDLKRNLIYIFEQEKTTKTHIIPQITYNQTQICTSHMLAHILRQGCTCTDTNRHRKSADQHALTHRHMPSHKHSHTHTQSQESQPQQGIVGRVGGREKRVCMLMCTICLCIQCVCIWGYGSKTLCNWHAGMLCVYKVCAACRSIFCATVLQYWG